MVKDRELKKKIKRLEEKIEELAEENKELKQENKEIKRELNLYKNSNTPSSANKHLKPNTQGLKAKGKGKRGAPKGHPCAVLNNYSHNFVTGCNHFRIS